MPDPQALEGQIVSEREAVEAGKAIVDLWLEKINAAKAEEKDWRASAQKAAAAYEAAESANSHFNIYHANVETIVPALYNSTPIPDVRQRNEPEMPDESAAAGVPPEQAQALYQQIMMAAEAKAKLSRDVAEVTERALATSVDLYDFDDVIEDVVRDGEVTGRGVPRIRVYDETEECRTELVPWNRFIRGPGLSWHTVPFIAFEHDLTKDEVARIIDKPGRVQALKFTQPREDGTDFGTEKEKDLRNKGILKTIKVYEIWDRLERKVLFVTPDDKSAPLNSFDDPLGLRDFFPVPKPLYKIRRTTSLVPVCPYDVYAPLIEEIEKISQRIKALVKQLVIKGGYDPKMAPEFESLKDAEDGTYVPITSSEDFVSGAKGGLENAVMHWPLDQIVKVIETLYQEREAVKQSIYEVMGVSDIMRGQVDPREKATQSQIKDQSGSRRLKRSQNEVQRITRDLFRMKTEIIVRKFSPETLQDMTGMMITPEMLQVLQSDKLRTYSIDIETDSTVRADMSRFQEEMNSFLQGTAQFGQALAGMAPVMPQLIAPMTKVYAGFARKFNLGKQGEDALEKMIEAGQQPPQQPNQDNGEAERLAQLQSQQMSEQHQLKMQELDAKQKMDGEKHAADMESKQLDIQIKLIDLDVKRQSAGLDMAKKAADLEADERRSDMELSGKQADLEHRGRLAAIAERQKQNGNRPRA